MLSWFTQKVPIRRQRQIAFGVQICLVAVQGACAAFPAAIPLSPSAKTVLCGSVVIVSVVAAFLLSRTMAGPYVTTMLRMEALAAAALDSTIAYTDRTNRAGRLTKAMQASRDAALARIGARQTLKASSQLLQVEEAI